ncbi:hypothetical protein PAV_109p00310 (plasmid) [Paenibacillus alvei DSM 29]|uniref:hypothetical protein n=1 Tax=Paenibacillus alvei TaxID=44250 RepID=UPI000288536B|nr:hypothetical protein [Paenibacillus alvei]EJW13801.1 hypothetical protein PAV_109p00310 [Paenibacillus alvei DSM 29]
MGKFITIIYPFIVIFMFYQIISLADLSQFSSLALFEKSLVIFGLVFATWIIMVVSWRWIYKPVWTRK